MHYDIGSPMKTDVREKNIGEDVGFLDDGPNVFIEWRFQSPTRPPATKRKKNIHVEGPATKRSIVGEMTDDENELDIDSLKEKRGYLRIVSLALLGRSMHEVYSNSLIDTAVARQSAEAMMFIAHERGCHGDLQS